MPYRPYRGVIAEKQIRRLQSQVNDARKKQLTGRASTALDNLSEFRDEDFIEYDDLQSLPPHHRRPCQINSMMQLASTTGTNKSRLDKASARKLLEASLVSLETLG